MIADFIIAKCNARAPDFIVGGHDNPYLLRWWVIPRNRVFNIYAHCFLRSDDDRAHHCHPWLFRLSWILRGSYIVHWIARGGVHRARLREAGSAEFCWGASPHRVELLGFAQTDDEVLSRRELVPQPCWTLFITGPVVREWGFHCLKGWVPWQQFVSARDKGSIGRGCD